jgi:hypothetical protein
LQVAQAHIPALHRQRILGVFNLLSKPQVMAKLPSVPDKESSVSAARFHC